MILDTSSVLAIFLSWWNIWLKQLKEEKVWFRLTVQGEVMVAGQGDSWSHCSHSQNAGGDGSWCSTLFTQHGTPALEWGPAPPLGWVSPLKSFLIAPQLCLWGCQGDNQHSPSQKDAMSGPVSFTYVSLYLMSTLFWLQNVLILCLYHVLWLCWIWRFPYILRFSKGLATGKNTNGCVQILFSLRSMSTLHDFPSSLWPQVGTWLDFNAATWLLWLSLAQVPGVSFP